jgi:hypothetical protein
VSALGSRVTPDPPSLGPDVHWIRHKEARGTPTPITQRRPIFPAQRIEKPSTALSNGLDALPQGLESGVFTEDR